MKTQVLTFLRSHKGPLLLLNVVVLVFYFWFLHYFDFFDSITETVFSTSDSNEYNDYTLFLTGHSDYCNPNRPFFYPLLLLIAKSIGGINGVWIMQIAFWLAACNLSFLSVRKMGGGILLSSISFLLIGTYFSAIILTTHGLTEITVLFLLSLLTYLLSHYFKKEKKPKVGLMAVALLAILFAVKPFFQLPMFLGIVFLVYYFETIRTRPVLFLWFALALSPAILQYSLNKYHHGVFVSDTLIEYNLRMYLANKVDYYEETNDLDGFDYLGDSTYRVRETRLAKLSNAQVRSYLWDHLGSTIIVMHDNFCDNVETSNLYLNKEKNPQLCMRSWKINGKFLRLHIYFFIGMFIYFVITIWKRRSELHLYLLFLGFICYMNLLSSGITFWAGDRIVIPSIAIWAVLYPVFLSQVITPLIQNNKYYKQLMQRFNQRT
jgi:hypothetical protein